MSSWDYFIQGFSLIFRKGLRRFVAIPLLINILLFIGMIWFAAHEFHRFVSWFEHLLPRWMQWLGWLLWLPFALAVIIFMAYTFSLIANIVAAPFNGFLSEKVETMLTGESLETAMTWSLLLKEAPRMILRQLQYAGYFLLRALLILVLFLIPGFQVLATPLWYVLSAWMMSVQYMDYPMDNHRIDFKRMRVLLNEKRGLNFTFGALVMVASMIPVVNFVVIPAAVAGATALFVNEYKVNHLSVS